MEDIVSGIQKVIAPITAKIVFEEDPAFAKASAGKERKMYLPETDTFDTWFSSGQWPYVTLKTTKKGDFEKFYPTSVMETGYDILRAWVSRMLMLGLYVANGKHETDLEKIKNTVPFKDVVLHGLVNDPYGKKMSKSKGNVVNPLEVVDQCGADAVRFALVYGTGLGNDQAMSYSKLDAARKFTNKLWNMARFIEFQMTSYPNLKMENSELNKLSKDEFTPGNQASLCKDIIELSKEISKYLNNYQFNLAAERLYEFAWHQFADLGIEQAKEEMKKEDLLNRQRIFTVITSSYLTILKLLHPFMPFVTEEIYQRLYPEEAAKTPLMISFWPK